MQAISGLLVLRIDRTDAGSLVTATYTDTEGAPLVQWSTITVQDGQCWTLCPVYALPHAGGVVEAGWSIAFDPESIEQR